MISALLILCGGVLLIIIHPGFVPPMDDTYIHLVYGRSILTDSPLSFNPGEPSTGFTSPLWLLPAIISSALFSSSAPLLIMIFSLIAGVIVFLKSSKIQWAGILILSGPFLFHVTSGMETGLAVLFVVLIWFTLTGKKNSPVLDVFLFSGAVLCRPELVVLGLPILLKYRHYGLKSIILLSLGIVPILLWVLWNLHASGLPFPSTFYAKTASAGIHMAEYTLPSLVKNLLLAAPLLLLFYIKASWDLMKKRSILFLPAFVLLIAEIISQPNSYFQLRYYVPFLSAAALTVAYWLKGFNRSSIIAILIALSMLPGIIIFVSRRIDSSVDVNSIDRVPALLLSDIAESGQTVATADIGAVGWFTELYILDLDGLVSKEMLDQKSRNNWGYIAEQSDYLLAFPVQYSYLTEQAENQLEMIALFDSPCPVICGEKSVVLWRIRK